VRDAQGKKMTKSRGNVVDPLEIMEKYGTDAVRFTLAQLTVQGRDLVLSDDRLAASRAFANKIWNAARFVLMNLEGAPQPVEQVEPPRLSLAERWILSRLNATIRAVTWAIDAYEFNVAALNVYQFIWHEFCDWYIELSKEPLKSGGERQAAARYVLVHCFDRMLRLLHPFMPFISEEIWQTLRPYLSESHLSEHLAVAKWPQPEAHELLSEMEAASMERCIAATQTINSLRSLLQVHPGERVNVYYRRMRIELQEEMQSWTPYSAVLCKSSEFLPLLDLTAAEPSESGRNIVFQPLDWGEFGIAVPLGSDVRKLRASLHKKQVELQKHLNETLGRLDNPDFVAKAGPELQQEMTDRAANLTKQCNLISGQISLLEQAA